MRSPESMTVSINPVFLEGERGRIFALHFYPGSAPRAHLVFLPPFCEEMNRCRHLVADQANRFAAAGYSCLILDPYGTGDSEGELADASWEGWRADALTAVRWCQEGCASPVVLWGLRLGALLALDMAATYAGQFAKLLLWQPVTNGKTYLTQILRTRIAYLTGNGLPPETTEEMRLALQRGEHIEVAGYVLGGRLVGDIDGMTATSFASLSGTDIQWLQQSSRTDEAPSAAVQKVVDQLVVQGNTVAVIPFQSPPLWQLSERADCSQLLEKTSALRLL
jgi:exosortase A-associated hydrolase 2